MANFSNSDYFWFSFAVHVFSVMCCFVLTIWHSINVFRDFCTKKRNAFPSNSHRQIPAISLQYICLTLIQFFSLWLFLIYLSVAMLSFFKFSEFPQCTFLSPTTSIAYCSGKLFLYLALITRLHIVYNGSVFQYRFWLLFAVAFVESFGTLAVNVGLGVGVEAVDAVNDKYPFLIKCQVTYPQWTFVLAFFIETSVQIFCLFAFLRPLVTMAKQQESVDTVKHFWYVGVKLTIITFVSMLTTLFSTLCIALLQMGVFFAFDAVINSICIMLMCPYYDNKTYYERICCLWKRCCDSFQDKNLMHLTMHSPKIGPNGIPQQSPTATPKTSSETITASASDFNLN